MGRDREQSEASEADDWYKLVFELMAKRHVVQKMIGFCVT